MKKFRTKVESICLVAFSDEKKAEEFFLNGEWKKYFWNFESLEELSAHISANMIGEFTNFSGDMITLEGFGTFKRDNFFNDTCILSSAEFGDIIVELECLSEICEVEEVNE